MRKRKILWAWMPVIVALAVLVACAWLGRALSESFAIRNLRP